MATGLPLFPGRSDIDQLIKIFQRRGTPDPNTNWHGVDRLPHYNAEFPKWGERPITDFVPMSALASNQAADLLTALLQYDQTGGSSAGRRCSILIFRGCRA